VTVEEATMAFIETIPPREADGEVLAMYERQQKSWGFVPNYARVFCHRPEVMQLWAALLRGIRSHMDTRRFELVTLAAAGELRSSYCSLAHGKALTAFLAEADVARVVTDPDSVELSATERAIVRLARKVAHDANTVTVDDVQPLKDAGLADGEIFDIVAAAAARSFLTKLVDGLGAQPDSSFLEMSEELRASLTVGRPISSNQVERTSALVD
jgi:uncharacterized peroxidase-related enzyme